jgi:hypothetical protein
MRRRALLTRAFTLLVAVAVALAVSACFGSGADKAGGPGTEQPVVLTLADHAQGPTDVQLWIEEVQRRPGESLRIQVTNRCSSGSEWFWSNQRRWQKPWWQAQEELNSPKSSVSANPRGTAERKAVPAARARP